MPSSFWTSISDILDIVMHLDPRPSTILDIGFGFGKYGFLLKEYLTYWGYRYEDNKRPPTIDGIEANQSCASDLQNLIYDHIYIGNATEIVKKIQKSEYDLVLLIDVLEHLSKIDGDAFIKECKRIGKTVIISTPAIWENQNDAYGNPFERHLSLWDKKMLNNAGSVYTTRVSDLSWIAVITDDQKIRNSLINFAACNNRFRKLLKLILPYSFRALFSQIPVE